MKTLIHFDQIGFDSYVKQFNLPLAKFKVVLEAWKALGIGTIETQEFQDLFDGKIDCLVFDKMSEGKEMVLMGMKLNKTKCLDLIERPEGFKELVDKIEELKKHYSLSDTYSGFVSEASHLPESYEIVENELIVSPDLLEAKKESDFSYYVVSQKQKEVFDVLNNFVNGLNALADKKLCVNDSHESNHCLDNFLAPLRHVHKNSRTVIDYSSLNSVLRKFKD